MQVDPQTSPNRPLRHPTTNRKLDIFLYDGASEGGAAKVVQSSNAAGDDERITHGGAPAAFIALGRLPRWLEVALSCDNWLKAYSPFYATHGVDRVRFGGAV